MNKYLKGKELVFWDREGEGYPENVLAFGRYQGNWRYWGSKVREMVARGSAKDQILYGQLDATRHTRQTIGKGRNARRGVLYRPLRRSGEGRRGSVHLNSGGVGKKSKERVWSLIF